MESNKGIIIALIKSAIEKEPVGYRVLINGAIKNVPQDSLIDAMKKSDLIVNAKVENGKIIGTQGSMDRYPIITPYNSILRGGITILKKYRLMDRDKKVIQHAFEIMDCKGRTEICTADVIVQYTEENWISNGKIVNSRDRKFISAINGEYSHEDVLEEVFCNNHDVRGYTN